jgi:hypothetical protein
MTEANTNARHYTGWHKSTRSGGGDDCVEVATAADGTIGVRDSKKPDRAILEFTPTEWKAFLDGAKDGEFDN